MTRLLLRSLQKLKYLQPCVSCVGGAITFKKVPTYLEHTAKRFIVFTPITRSDIEM